MRVNAVGHTASWYRLLCCVASPAPVDEDGSSNSWHVAFISWHPDDPHVEACSHCGSAPHGCPFAPFATTPNIKQLTMATPTREALASLLEDRIEILDRNTNSHLQAGQVFRTVGAILAFVRVRALLLRSLVDSSISPMT